LETLTQIIIFFVTILTRISLGIDRSSGMMDHINAIYSEFLL